MIKEFKEFILKGNVLDLAVAVVIGAAFTAVVNALVTKILMPIVGIIFGKPTFDDALIVTINDSQILFGSFVTAVINFLIIGLAMFVVVKVANKMMSLRKKSELEEAEITEVDLLAEIRDLLSQRAN